MCDQKRALVFLLLFFLLFFIFELYFKANSLFFSPALYFFFFFLHFYLFSYSFSLLRSILFLLFVRHIHASTHTCALRYLHTRMHTHAHTVIHVSTHLIRHAIMFVVNCLRSGVNLCEFPAQFRIRSSRNRSDSASVSCNQNRGSFKEKLVQGVKKNYKGLEKNIKKCLKLKTKIKIIN